MSKLFLTDMQAFFLKPGLSSRHILAASTLAGDSVFGSASMDMTLGDMGHSQNKLTRKNVLKDNWG